MRALSSLEVSGFRNLLPQRLDLGPGVNLVFGPNGQGKTALLESVCVAADLRSFRTHDLRALLRHGQTSLRVAASDGISTLEVQLHADELGRVRRRAFIEGKLVSSSADWFHRKTNGGMGIPTGFQVVVFHPGDIQWIQSTPQIRRDYLDRLIAIQSPEYLTVLQNYRAALTHRNRMLKIANEGGRGLLPDEFEVFTQQLIRFGAQIRIARERLLMELLPRMLENLRELAPSQSEISAVIVTSKSREKTRQNLLKSLENQVGELADSFARLKGAERAAGVTLAGPHRDELAITVDDRPLKEVGSQGELKTVILALKIAELNWVRKCAAVPVVVLLDDLSSELDATRRRVIMKRFGDQGLQTLITSTAFEDGLVPSGAVQFGVEAGLFRKVA